MCQQEKNKSPRLTAKALKELIISFLLRRDPNGVIGLEVMYGSSRRVADIVFISKGHSYAIEIKSKYDNISRLEGQLLDYQTLFDYILVFSAPNHLTAVSEVIPQNAGLYCISEDGIYMIRHERINHHVQKKEMLLSIPSAIIKTDFAVKGKLTSDEIRSVVMKRSYTAIHIFFINYYKSKLSLYDSLKENHKSGKDNVAAENYIIDI